MNDVRLLVQSLERLASVLEADRELCDLAPAANQILQQARDIEADKLRLVKPLSFDQASRHISEAAARRLVEALELVPGVEPDTPARLKALGMLHGNLAIGVVSILFRDFPELVPK